MMTVRSFAILMALLSFALPSTAKSSKNKQPLPVGVYKAECHVPSKGSPLFLGQGIPTLYVHGHIDVVRDIHWLTLDSEQDLVGYALTASSGTIVLVPYTTSKVFTQQPKVLAASDYIPLGKFALSSSALSNVLRGRKLLVRPSETITVHPCFRSTWDGKYPPGS